MKQGGVISLILFCVYIDDLLNELANSGLTCHIGDVFAGPFGYADDLKLLTPSICMDYGMIEYIDQSLKIGVVVSKSEWK